MIHAALAEPLTYVTPQPLARKATELADTVGLSTVHVNRVLQRLRALELITLKNGRLVILDVEKLNAFSGFNPNYLHLSRQTASKKDDA